MQRYDFQVVMELDPALDVTEDAFLDRYTGLFFEAFGGDVMPAVNAGQPELDCSLVSATLEQAVRDVLHVVRNLGLRARHVLIEVDTLQAEAA